MVTKTDTCSRRCKKKMAQSYLLLNYSQTAAAERGCNIAQQDIILVIYLIFSSCYIRLAASKSIFIDLLIMFYRWFDTNRLGIFRHNKNTESRDSKGIFEENKARQHWSSFIFKGQWVSERKVGQEILDQMSLALCHKIRNVWLFILTPGDDQTRQEWASSI